jgi:molybdopterin-guanine dinucleotide biosynthesis protein A
MTPEPIGAVMAGGRSTRMGRPKATLELRGRPLISYPLEAFAAAGVDTVVVAKSQTALPELSVPVWVEPDEPAHPLLGIVTALERADGRPVVVCGCDMPFVEPSFIAYLATRCDPLVVPSFGGRLHPLLARYEPILLEPLTSALGSRKALQAIVAGLGPDLIDDRELGDPERLLFNVNTPADLDEAERLMDA